MKLIDISTKKHPNIFAMVDDEDFDFLNQWKWHKHDRQRPPSYATRGFNDDGKHKFIGMHRAIMAAKKGEIVDHINGDGLDNRRENLRICNAHENMRNRRKYTKSASIFKGVTVRKERGDFRAAIKFNGRKISLGIFLTEVDAAIAYNAGAVKYHGEFASLNIIPKDSNTNKEQV